MGDPSETTLVLATGIAMLIVIAIAITVYARSHVAAEQGHALVVSKPGGTDVRFGSSMVLPIVHRAEVIDLRTKTLAIDRRAERSISCRDGIRADVTLVAHVRVEATAEGVLTVARSVGCARASDPVVLEQLLGGKLFEALATVAAHLDFEQLQRDRQALKDEILSVVGRDLSGYVIDDVVIEHLEQTPLDQHDPHDIRDAHGIRKITELTSRERIRRHDIEQEAERQLRVQQHQLEELVIELERRKADALGRFREATGRELTAEELDARLDAGLRQVVERVLDARERTTIG